MIDDRRAASRGDLDDDEVGDVGDDVIYVYDDAPLENQADDAERSDEQDEPARFGWASVVTGAHYVLTWGRGRPGGADGTGAG